MTGKRIRLDSITADAKTVAEAIGKFKAAVGASYPSFKHAYTPAAITEMMRLPPPEPPVHEYKRVLFEGPFHGRVIIETGTKDFGETFSLLEERKPDLTTYFLTYKRELSIKDRYPEGRIAMYRLGRIYEFATLYGGKVTGAFYRFERQVEW